jgi:membrane-associated phospholipid phosphatase
MSIQPVLMATRQQLVTVAWSGLILFFLGLALKQWWGVPEPGFMWVNSWGRQAPELWACLTQLGDTSVVFALLAPVLCRHPRMYLAWLAAVPVGGAVSFVLKRGLDWPRPPDVMALDQLNVVGLVLNGRSFPSGHAITAVAVAMMVALHLPVPHAWRRPVQLGLLSLALGVLLSRLAVGAHWPTDVLAGAGVGLLSAVVAATVLYKMDVRPPEWAIWLAWALLGGTSLALADRVLDNEPGQAVLALAALSIWLSFLRAVWLRVR